MADTDWWRGSVTYQIYPRSFMDSNGDGIGDIPGITSRLGYVADLGVDAIWLSPIFTSPMKDMGYDVSDYRDIDPVFGTLSDFDEMVEAAHKLGLKVIIDQVISHASDQHPFFRESRRSRDGKFADWFVWADPLADGSAPNNWKSIFGGIAWEWEPRRHQYYFHNFLKEQPDWNFHNPAVQDYHLDNMRFWLDRGVDGFRLDTVNFYFHDKRLRNDAADFRHHDKPPAKPYDMLYHLFSKNQPENLHFLQRMRTLLDEYDARTLVGEVGESHRPIEMMAEYTSKHRLHMAYSFEMLSHAFTPEHFRHQIRDFFEGAPDGWPMWAFSNHDVERHVSRWLKQGVNSEAVARLAAAMLLSFEGSVCLYQGEELGQLETEMEFHELTDPPGIAFWPEDKGRDGCRTPMVWAADDPNGGFSTAASTWLPVKAPQRAHAVDRQAGREDSVLEFYRRMLALRRAEPALRQGGTRFLELAEPLLGFVRGEGILCVFNLSPTVAHFESRAPFTELLAEGAEVHADGQIRLHGNGFLIARMG